ncbi:MAG: hypothetical protein QRY16_19495 [Enterobacterales bacterium endosymbiont of Blomia tropicalis]|nr:hypothetical protein [Mixta mediterraneensis]MDL4915871.1 hypothetical protein [Mixta mediterraneensis]
MIVGRTAERHPAVMSGIEEQSRKAGSPASAIDSNHDVFTVEWMGSL